MKEKCVTEIVNFDVDADLTPEELVRLVDDLEEGFHMRQKGYIDSELVKGPGSAWILIMHWDSIEELRLASKALMTAPETEAFRKVVIPPSVKIFAADQVKQWKKQA